MMSILKIIGFITLGVIAVFVFRQIVETIINICVLLNKKNAYDITKQRNGMVYNKKKRKLEADQSVILPFE